MGVRGGFVSGKVVCKWVHLCTSPHDFYLLFLCLQLEGDTITLKPRPSADLTNSNAPSPSHKVQRSVSANPKQRRFSDQGECFGELQVADSPPPERTQVPGAWDDTAEFQSHFSHVLVAWPWASHLTSLNFKWGLPACWQACRRAPCVCVCVCARARVCACVCVALSWPLALIHSL